MNKKVENIVIVFIVALFSKIIINFILLNSLRKIFSYFSYGAEAQVGFSLIFFGFRIILDLLLIVFAIIFIVRYWNRPIFSQQSRFIYPIILISVVPLVYFFFFINGARSLVLPLSYKLKKPIVCKMIMNNNLKNVCYQDLAIIKKDPNLCLFIEEKMHSQRENEQFTNSWRRECNTYVSIAIGETIDCGEMADQICFSRVAGLLDDVSYCNKLSSIKKAHLESDQDNCFFWASAQRGNKEFCLYINNPLLKQKCEDY